MYDLKYISDNGKIIHFNQIQQTDIDTNTGRKMPSWFSLAPVDLTVVPIDVVLSQGIGQIGGTVQGEAVQSKDLVLNGQVIGFGKNRRKQLLDTVLPQVGGKLVYNDTWELAVRPMEVPRIENYDYNSRYQITLRAPYPYWVNHKFEIIDLAGLIARFKFPVNYAAPHIFGERIRLLSTNVYNDGNVPANFIVAFRAVTPLSNPQIIKVRTQEFIKVNRDMLAGDSVVFDMTVSPMKLTSTYNRITTNIFGNLDMASTPFKLDVGDNVLQYEADVNRDGLECRIIFRNAYTGPW